MPKHSAITQPTWGRHQRIPALLAASRDLHGEFNRIIAICPISTCRGVRRKVPSGCALASLPDGDASNHRGTKSGLVWVKAGTAFGAVEAGFGRARGDVMGAAPRSRGMRADPTRPSQGSRAAPGQPQDTSASLPAEPWRRLLLIWGGRWWFGSFTGSF